MCCIINYSYHMSHANVQESMGKPCRYTELIYLYYKSCENPYQAPYQVLQVMCTMPEWAIKLKVVLWLYLYVEFGMRVDLKQ